MKRQRYPLVTAWRKYHRATKHIRDFEARWPAVAKKQPHALTRDPETGRGEYVHERIVGDDSLADLSLIAGDALYNLRSALDHVAYALAVSRGTLTLKQLEGVYFVISPARKKFEDRIRKGVEGRIGADWVAFLRSVQPYYRRNGRDLWRLHDLNRIDKHRSLLTFSPYLVTTVQRGGGEWLTETLNLKKGVVRISLDPDTNLMAAQEIAFRDAAFRKKRKGAMLDMIDLMTVVQRTILAAQDRFFPIARP